MSARKLGTAVILPAICLMTSLATQATSPRQRIVSLTAETPSKEINRYFSLAAHGPTQKFHMLLEDRAVVIVRTADGTSTASATVVLFAEDATIEGMERWINNRHSDALYPDAAQPLVSIDVPDDAFHAEVGPVLAHEVGDGGDEYDRVHVDFTIDAFENEHLQFRPCTGGLDAFIRTKNLPKP